LPEVILRQHYVIEIQDHKAISFAFHLYKFQVFSKGLQHSGRKEESKKTRRKEGRKERKKPSERERERISGKEL
jgi:hypothetical protein